MSPQVSLFPHYSFSFSDRFTLVERQEKSKSIVCIDQSRRYNSFFVNSLGPDLGKKINFFRKLILIFIATMLNIEALKRSKLLEARIISLDGAGDLFLSPSEVNPLAKFVRSDKRLETKG